LVLVNLHGSSAEKAENFNLLIAATGLRRPAGEKPADDRNEC
jgi:hypothetical protein